jgi:hypothetical protein
MYLKFMQAHRDQRQSNELTRGPPKVSSALSFIWGGRVADQEAGTGLAGRPRIFFRGRFDLYFLCTPYTSLKISSFYAFDFFEMKIAVIQ